MAFKDKSEVTVLKYVKLDFQGQWEWYFDEYSFRPVERTGQLLVVSETPGGGLETHWFVMRRRPETPGAKYWHECVYVPRENDTVFIPERCSRRAPGDHTRCLPSRADVVFDPAAATKTKARRRTKRARRK